MSEHRDERPGAAWARPAENHRFEKRHDKRDQAIQQHGECGGRGEHREARDRLEHQVFGFLLCMTAS